MKRIKVSENFSLDEFINPTTYKKFGYKSQRYIRPEVIRIAQTIRSFTGLSVTINNWATGGGYKESGLRDFTTSTGASYSAHKFGAGADLKIGKLTSHEMAKIVIDNWDMFKELGLTRIENPDFTKGKNRDWLHFDVLWTGSEELQIVNP
jgi:hypothetical protein